MKAMLAVLCVIVMYSAGLLTERIGSTDRVRNAVFAECLHDGHALIRAADEDGTGGRMIWCEAVTSEEILNLSNDEPQATRL